MPEPDWKPSAQYASWPGCRKCRHFQGTHCDAYPIRIPPPIISGQVDHMVPRPGDRFPFATLPGDRKWYPLFADPWLAQVTDREAEIVAGVCGPLATELGYTSGQGEHMMVLENGPRVHNLVSVLSAPVIPGRCLGCRRSGISRRPIARAP